MLPQAAYLRIKLDSLETGRRKLEWLAQIVAPLQRVVNFGCSVGGETLELMWALNATEAVGVDVSSEKICQAQSTLRTIQEDIAQVERAITDYRETVGEDDLVWWANQVPDFLKQRRFPKYIERDMTQTTSLPSDHFDLAFCDYVLYHICGELDEQGSRDVQAAIREMARVVRPGGWVVAVEPTRRSPTDARSLNFRPFFEQAGLTLATGQNDAIILPEPERTYLYRKPG